VDPKQDIDIINTELILADLQTLDKYLPKLQKESKADPKKRDEVATLEQARVLLDSGKPLSASDIEIPKNLQLLTAKQVIYVFNVDEQALGDTEQKNKLQALVSPAAAVFVCAKLEEELKGLDANDQQEMLTSYGVTESGLVQLVKAAYNTLGLQSYLTAGDKEVRAWTIRQGATAPEAAGVIHTDFEKGFIAAEIMSYEDLSSLGSELAVRQAGKARTVGRDYTMQPNDVVEFRFNVKK
jgi:GTP-binding protein YchF